MQMLPGRFFACTDGFLAVFSAVVDWSFYRGFSKSRVRKRGILMVNSW
jgi:hypothetical protein